MKRIRNHELTSLIAVATGVVLALAAALFAWMRA